MSFDEIKNVSSLNNQPKFEDNVQTQYDREEKYPWLSDETLKITNINTFMHNEILDFVQWIE